MIAALLARWGLKLVPYLAALLVVAGTHLAAYWAGQDDIRVEVAEQRAVEERARENDRIRRTEQSEKVAEAVTVEVEKVRTVYRTITKEVPVYVPSDSPLLPSGFRLLHDAAAEGRPPAPPGSPDAAPVAAQDVAATVIDNYEACRLNAERLGGLQRWVKEQTE